MSDSRNGFAILHRSGIVTDDYKFSANLFTLRILYPMFVFAPVCVSGGGELVTTVGAVSTVGGYVTIMYFFINLV